MINLNITTPTDKKYVIIVEGSKCRGLIHVFNEIEDIPCKTWIYKQLSDKITNSTPYFKGEYLGYSWEQRLN